MGSWPKLSTDGHRFFVVVVTRVYIPKQAVIWPIMLTYGPNGLRDRPTPDLTIFLFEK